MTDPAASEVASEVLRRYVDHYDGEIQGCCPVIADEIQRRVGGDVVAGICWFMGNSRTHWWVEKDGVVIDPMGDWMFSPEDHMTREECHRDRAIFDSILPQYERWRVAA